MNRVNASWVESEGGNTVELLIAPSKRPFRTSLGQLEPAVSKIVAKTLEDEAVKLRGCSNPSRRCPVTWTAPRRRYSFISQTNQTSPTVEPPASPHSAAEGQPPWPFRKLPTGSSSSHPSGIPVLFTTPVTALVTSSSMQSLLFSPRAYHHHHHPNENHRHYTRRTRARHS